MKLACRLALAVTAAATALAGFRAPAALAFDAAEYTAASFTGGYVEPPAPPTTGTDTGLLIGANQDDRTAEAVLPFEFPFFGRLYSRVSVCTNGWLAFGSTTSVVSANPSLPSTSAPNGIVAALWDDLQTGTAGRVRTFTTGTAPNRVFVVVWLKVDTFSAGSSDELSFEVKLHETTGAIEVAYATTGTWDGLSYTAGIESPDGLTAFGAGNLGNANSGQPQVDWRFTPRAHTVTGTLLRDRPIADASGLGNATANGIPVVGIDLELVRADTGEVAARGRPAADGTFSVPALGSEAGVQHSLRLASSGEECRVIDAAGATYTLVLANGLTVDDDTVSVGTVTLDASLDATAPAIRRAVNVQQAAQRAFAWARDAAAAAVEGSVPAVAAETFPRLDVKFVPGAAASGSRTHYAPAAAEAAAVLNLSDAPENPDSWDDDVILRDCAHHVFAVISVHPGTQPVHTWATSTTATGAFVDGFAHWFTCAVQGRSTFIDTKSATEATVFDLEVATPAPARAPDVTGAIACALWDLVDDASELPEDPFFGTNGTVGSTSFEVMKTIDRSLDTPTTVPEAKSFFDAWRVGAPDVERANTARVFIHHGALADDAREPNDLPGEASVVTANQRVDGLILNKYNEDRYEVAFAPTAESALSVAVSQTTAADFDLYLLDADDQELTFATTVGATSRARLVATTPNPVPAGTYRVRVVWRGGTVATYSLAFFEPLRLGTLALPAWTATEPLKFDLAAAGGVAPYTFTTTAAIPGVAVTQSGTRLIGTPTTAGTFAVDVNITDASGSGVTAATTLSLTVNPPLELPEWYGVESGATVDAAVGAGGTDAVWTSTSAGDGDLAVVAGPTLRVVGSSGEPRSFDVQGAATDAAAATPSRTTSHVVVCDALPGARAAALPSSPFFGFWFDAFAGSRVDLRFRFRGSGKRPFARALVSESGETVPLHDLQDVGGDAVPAGTRDTVDGSGFVVRLHGVRIPTSGRWFVIFEQRGATPFAGTVRRAGRVREPSEAHGLVVLAAAEDTEIATFEASCSARLRITLRGAEVPRRVTPELLGVREPDGTLVNPLRLSRRGFEATWAFVSSPVARGAFVLTIGGNRAGPVFWRVRIGRSRNCASAF